MTPLGFWYAATGTLHPTLSGPCCSVTVSTPQPLENNQEQLPANTSSRPCATAKPRCPCTNDVVTLGAARGMPSDTAHAQKDSDESYKSKSKRLLSCTALRFVQCFAKVCHFTDALGPLHGKNFSALSPPVIRQLGAFGDDCWLQDVPRVTIPREKRRSTSHVFTWLSSP
ncbi:hypothetical protein DR999_PMT02927 [Platysternon megacephalum]|uniref:Uncharacterized protein n=1 Tax=Platysternon megacephalum TaxID=55544 RepID=A0A4D9F3G0_9SAUR|nr:hypothetical protein DR999_PMT02927 [Platysternon megacephalum]